MIKNSRLTCAIVMLVAASWALGSPAMAKKKAKAKAGAKKPAATAPAKTPPADGSASDTAAAPAAASGESAATPAPSAQPASASATPPAAAPVDGAGNAAAPPPERETSTPPATAAASPAASPTPAAPPTTSGDRDNGGIRAGVKLAYASPSSIIDASGKGQSLSGVGLSYFVADLNGIYDFHDSSLGLYVGLGLPIVRNSITAASVSHSSAGVGEPSLFVGSRLEVLPGIEAGGQFRFKAGIAGPPTNGPGRGSGYHNVQVDLFGRTRVAGVGVELDAGYILTVSSGESVGPGPNSVMVDPGDILSIALMADYPVNEMISPRLSVLFANSGNTTWDGTALPDSGSRWLALALDVNIRVSDTLSAQVGWGTPMTALGINLPYGFVLVGKNTPNGWLALNAGATAKF